MSEEVHPERNAQVLALYNSGKPPREIRRETGLTYGQVCGILTRARERGGLTPSDRPNQYNAVPFTDVALAVELYQSGLSSYAVAERLGVYQAKIARLLRKLNVPRRKPNDPLYKKPSIANIVERDIREIMPLAEIAALYRGRVYG